MMIIIDPSKANLFQIENIQKLFLKANLFTKPTSEFNFFLEIHLDW